MGLEMKSCRILALLPIIEVAWADGVMHAKERKLIEQLASERFKIDFDGQRLLDGWLKYRPTKDYLNRNRDLLVALAHSNHTKLLSVDDLSSLTQLCLDTAKVSGGLFGMGAIAPSERAVLTTVDGLLDTDANMALEALYTAHDPGPDPPTGVFAAPEDVALLAQPEVAWRPIVPPEKQEAALVLVDDAQDRAYPLRGQRINIGRSPDNDVQIRFDHRVSRSHCQLVLLSNGWAIEDLGSANGTYLNGPKVRAETLRDGDELQVGLVRFVFSNNGEDYEETAYDLPIYSDDGDEVTHVVPEGILVRD